MTSLLILVGVLVAGIILYAKWPKPKLIRPRSFHLVKKDVDTSTIRTYNVLIIEDNKKASDLLQKVIHRMNRNFLTYELNVSKVVQNVFEAHEVFDPNEFDLIIVDEMLPFVYGSRFVAFLRSKGITTPVIFASGAATTELQRITKEYNAIASFPKPLDEDKILMAIENVKLLNRG
jgi:DNA-binding response OmpR family regulator